MRAPACFTSLWLCSESDERGLVASQHSYDQLYCLSYLFIVIAWLLVVVVIACS